MDEILKKLESLKSATALKDNERNKIDSVVTSFMDSYKPKKEESSKLNFMQLFNLNWTRKLAVSLASLFVVSSAGVVYASSIALPGDALYGLKLGLENIQGWSKLSDQSKADFAIDKIQTRLDEIKKLNALRGEVSPEALALIQEKISEYSNDIAMATEILKNNKDGGRMAEITEKLQMITSSELEDIKFNTLLETIVRTEAESKQAQFQMSSHIIKEVSSQKLTTTQGGLKIYQPQAGDVITQRNGTMYYMDWASIENAQYYEVSLLNENGVKMGIIFVESLNSQDSYNYLSTDVMWDGRMIFDSNGNYSGNKIKTGNYKIEVVAKDWNGDIYWGNSATFSIVEGVGLIEMVGTAQQSPISQATPESILQDISEQFGFTYTASDNVIDWSTDNGSINLSGKAITLKQINAYDVSTYFTGAGFSLTSVADGVGHSISNYTKGKIGCKLDVTNENQNGLSDSKVTCANLTDTVGKPTELEEVTVLINDFEKEYGPASEIVRYEAENEWNINSNGSIQKVVFKATKFSQKDSNFNADKFFTAEGFTEDIYNAADGILGGQSAGRRGFARGDLKCVFEFLGENKVGTYGNIDIFCGYPDEQLVTSKIPTLQVADFDGNGVILKGENLAGSYISFVNTSAGILCREMITPNCVLEKTTSTDTTIKFISNWIGSPGTYQFYVENPTTGESNKVDLYIKPIVK